MAFCSSSVSIHFSEKLSAELETVALSGNAFSGPDGLLLLSAYTRLISSISHRSNRLASLLINFIVTHFSSFLYGFEDGLLKNLQEKFDSIVKFQRVATGRSSIFFFRMTDESSEEEAEAYVKAQISQRGQKQNLAPFSKLVEHLRIEPDELGALIFATESAGTIAASTSSKPIVFIFALFAEITTMEKLRPMQSQLVESIAKVINHNLPQPTKNKRLLLWKEGLRFIKVQVSVRMLLSG